MPSRKAARHYYDRRMAIVRCQKKRKRLADGCGSMPGEAGHNVLDVHIAVSRPMGLELNV
jgi:hypothetical protein